MMTAELKLDIPPQHQHQPQHQFSGTSSATSASGTNTAGSNAGGSGLSSDAGSGAKGSGSLGQEEVGPEADQKNLKTNQQQPGPQPLNGTSLNNQNQKENLSSSQSQMASSDAPDHPSDGKERPSAKSACASNSNNPASEDPACQLGQAKTASGSGSDAASAPSNGAQTQTTTKPQATGPVNPPPSTSTPQTTSSTIGSGNSNSATGVSVVSQSEDEIDEEDVLETENDPGEAASPVKPIPSSGIPGSHTQGLEMDMDEAMQMADIKKQVGAQAAEAAVVAFDMSGPTTLDESESDHLYQTAKDHLYHSAKSNASPESAVALHNHSSAPITPTGNSVVDVDEIIERQSPVPPESEVMAQDSESSVDFDAVLNESPVPHQLYQRPQQQQTQPQIQPKLAAHRAPPIKAIVEEDSQILESSQPLTTMSGHNAASASNFASKSLDTLPDADDVSVGESSVAASVASTPGTQQAVRRASQRVLQVTDDPKTKDALKKSAISSSGKRRASRASSHSSRQSLDGREVTRSNSFKVNRMWRGIKKKINVVAAVKGKKSKSKSPNRKISDASQASGRSAADDRSPSRESSAASLMSTSVASAASHTRRGRAAAAASAATAPSPRSSNRGARINRTNTGDGGGSASARRNRSPTGTPFRRVHTSPVRTRPAAQSQRQASPVRNRVGRFAASVAAGAIPSGTERGRPVSRIPPTREEARSRSEEPVQRKDSFGKKKLKEPPTEEYLKELEGVAKALKDGLTYSTMPDRSKKTTFDKCFAGSAAVDFLSNYTRKSRPEALQVGRELVEHFGLFVHVGGGGVVAAMKVNSADGSLRSTGLMTGSSSYSSFLLQDSNSTFYRMVAYLPMEVQRMNMMTKVRLFEEGVKVKTRRQGLRKHKKCFVGSEAVQFLVRTRMTKTRAEAVALGRKFVKQFNLFEPVLRDSDFEDSRNKLYRFVDKRNRYFSIDNMLSTRLISMGREDTDISGGDDDDEKDDDAVSSVGGSSFVSRSTKGDSEEFDKFAQADEGEDELPAEYQRLTEVAEILERGIKVGDNSKKPGTKKGVSYLDTFVAARAVTFMVTSGLAESREEAAKLGRRLEREFNLFTEVSGKHDFDDSMYYFRFTDKKERFSRPVKAELPLKEVAATFEQGVRVKDHTYRLKTYKRTFIGSSAVDFLVNTRLATSRSHAVRLGCQLVEKYNLFEKVTGYREFADDQVYFRFTPLDYRTVPEEDLPQHKRKRRSGRAFLLNRSEASRASLVPKNVSEAMLANAEQFLNGVKVKEHKFRAKAYRGTFIGSEAVSFMVNSSLAKSRKDAVDLGRKLTQEVGLFLGIDGKKDFKDDYLLYRFSQQFEEQLKGSGDSKTPLRGLVSAVSGLNSVNLKSLPLEVIAEAFRKGVKVGDGMENAEQRRSVGAELLKSSGDMMNKTGEMLRGTGDALKGSGRDHLDDKKEKDKKSKKKKKGKKPDDAFVGTDAVDFLVGSGLAEGRVEAVDLGRTLAREFGLFEHCDQEHEFEDEEFFYRFCYEGEIRPMETIHIDVSRLMDIAKDFETCVKVKENKFRLRKYKKTFLGCDAVDYLVDSCTATSRKEAVQIGRAITKEFNLFEHVTNDRQFEDSSIPYFFVNDSQRYKGLNLEKKRARRNIFASSDDDDSESSNADMRGSANSQSMNQASFNFSFNVENAEDKDWANKMANFERRMHSTQAAPFISTRHLISNDDDSSQSSSEIRKDTMQKRFMEWASKFHRLDPRYQIRYFFDFVAQDGAENAETNVMDVDNLRPLYNFLPSRAQVFTVWRPTSADAIRKMMLGEAVGKGLDIKGKSAKRGKLSGFVPFLQIGENKHKSKIRTPSKEGVVRVFYPGDSRRGRDIAAEKLERVGMEMIETVEGAKAVLADNDASKSARKDALDAMLLDLGPDPSITYIDDYAPDRYGLEIPERLFWEAFFVRQDCTRKPGSEYDTGRPSQPAFQDMNFAAIRAEPKEDAPRAVVYQSADSDSPMNPFELLVAYEEQGRVMPVVSDFDCFLVGTKRVNFQSTLAPEQLNVLKWYTGEIENVMKSSKVGDSWTVNWLEILKKAAREGFYPEMPRFGFGDPKSYSIMKNAVSRLSHSGAVRHGAECFNYYFPQDLDDEFLVIANDLPDNKPWAYVDVEGLQDILEEKIEQGFTFPLNPKWVLCDAFRWKELYDKLLLSDKKETQQSMNVWFPPDSGIRDLIERVHKSRPSGFYKSEDDPDAGDDSSSSSSGGGDAGAKETMMSTVFAIRLLEKFQERTKKYQSSGESAASDSD